MHKNKFPPISTIIPVLNGARYISQAIESILAQDYPNMEIIVVDDGSTDDTRSVVSQFGKHLIYFYQDHKGIPPAMNHGLTKASGDYFAFLDADDYWLPGKIKKQMDLLKQDASVDMVFHHVKQFYSPELIDMLKDKYSIPGQPTPGIHAGSMLISRTAFFRVGLFSEQWEKGHFTDWYTRAVEAGLKFFMMPDVFYMRRIHDTNHGITHRDHSIDYVRMLKAALDRRRGTNKETGHEANS